METENKIEVYRDCEDLEIDTSMPRAYRLFILVSLVPIAIIVQFTLLGFINNIGVIKEFWNKYPMNHGFLLDQAGSVNFGLIYTSALISNLIMNKIGQAQTYIIGCISGSLSILMCVIYPSDQSIFAFYGVLLGISANLIIFPMFCTIKDCFTRNLSLVNGLIVSGSCVGTMLQAYIINHICTKYDWILLFKYFSVALFLLSFFGFFLYEANRRIKITKCFDNKSIQISHTFLLASVMKNTKFIVLSAACFVFCLGYPTMFLHIKSYSTFKNIDGGKSHLLIGYFSIGSLIGRLSVGFIANFFGKFRALLMSLCLFIMGFLSVMSVYCSTFFTMNVFCVMCGYFDGGLNALLFPVLIDQFKDYPPNEEYSDHFISKQMNLATAFYYAIQGISMIIGPLIINIMLNYSYSLSTVFQLSGSFMIASSLILLVIPFIV